MWHIPDTLGPLIFRLTLAVATAKAPSKMPYRNYKIYILIYYLNQICAIRLFYFTVVLIFEALASTSCSTRINSKRPARHWLPRIVVGTYPDRRGQPFANELHFRLAQGSRTMRWPPNQFRYCHKEVGDRLVGPSLRMSHESRLAVMKHL